MQLFQIEVEKFGMQKICLTPVRVEGAEPKVWAMSDARNTTEPVIELKSEKMSIWVLQRCVGELNKQVIIRGPRGFVTAAMTDLLRSQATPFVDENSRIDD